MMDPYLRMGLEGVRGRPGCLLGSLAGGASPLGSACIRSATPRRMLSAGEEVSMVSRIVDAAATTRHRREAA